MKINNLKEIVRLTSCWKRDPIDMKLDWYLTENLLKSVLTDIFTVVVGTKEPYLLLKLGRKLLLFVLDYIDAVRNFTKVFPAISMQADDDLFYR